MATQKSGNSSIRLSKVSYLTGSLSTFISTPSTMVMVTGSGDFGILYSGTSFVFFGLRIIFTVLCSNGIGI
jgi:hypothetical protein